MIAAVSAPLATLFLFITLLAALVLHPLWGRLLRVYMVAARVYLSVCFHRRFYPGSAPKDLAAWQRAHRANASRLAAAAIALEGLWIKCAQYCSSRADVLPESYLEILAQCQDSCSPRPFTDIAKTILEETGSFPENLFQTFDPSPIASASIAQVHIATLRETGKQVAVKVQHRNIARTLLADLELARRIVAIIAWVEPAYDLTFVMDEWCREVPSELDFLNEADNMRRVQRAAAHYNALPDCPSPFHVIFPQVIDNIASRRLLVMEYINGIKITATDELVRQDVDVNQIVQDMARAFGFQMLLDGAFSGDPHPGNVMCARDPATGRYCPVLLDFGLTKILDRKSKLGLCKMLCSAATSDFGSLLQSFDELGLQLAPGHENIFGAAMNITRFFFRESKPVAEAKQDFKDGMEQRKKMKQSQAIKMQDDKSLRRNPIDAFPESLIFFARALFLIRGLATTLGVRQNYLDLLHPYGQQALAEAAKERQVERTLVQISASVSGHTLKSALDAKLNTLASSQTIDGIQIAVWSRGRLVAHVCRGTQNAMNGTLVAPDTLFSLFSCSKAITATALHILCDRGLVSLDSPVCQYWPAFGKPEVTVYFVLTHQAGLETAATEELRNDPLAVLDWSRMARAMEQAKLEWTPGSKSAYHPLSFGFIVAGLVEKITGRTFYEFVQENIVGPLKLHGQLYLGMNGREVDVLSDRLALLTLDLKSFKGVVDPTGLTGQMGERPGSGAGRQPVLNPLLFNYSKIRAACIPAANGHASAIALGKFYAALIGAPILYGGEPLISARMLSRLRQRQPNTSFGLGLRLYDADMTGEHAGWIGHGGLGGSMGAGHVPSQTSVAVTVSQLRMKPTVASSVLQCVAEELGIPAPDISGADFMNTSRPVSK